MDESQIVDGFRSVSTASICTSLFKRGLRNQFIQGVVPLRPMGVNMVGRACTLRYIPAREDLNPIEVFTDPRHLQRRAVEECPSGYVLVIDSRKDARAASAGAILATRLAIRGCAGIVTDGGFRDSADIAALAMPSFHNRASAPTNITLHHAIDLDVPIGCGDAPVFPGDLIVGDTDGVAIVPWHLAAEILPEVLEMGLFETFVAECVQQGAPVIGLYPPTLAENRTLYAEWKQRRGR